MSVIPQHRINQFSESVMGPLAIGFGTWQVSGLAAPHLTGVQSFAFGVLWCVLGNPIDKAIGDIFLRGRPNEYSKMLAFALSIIAKVGAMLMIMKIAFIPITFNAALSLGFFGSILGYTELACLRDLFT